MSHEQLLQNLEYYKFHDSSIRVIFSCLHKRLGSENEWTVFYFNMYKCGCLLLKYIDNIPMKNQSGKFVIFLVILNESKAGAHTKLNNAKIRDTISLNKSIPVKFIGIFLDETLKCNTYFEGLSKVLRNYVFVFCSLEGCVSQATMRTHTLTFFTVYWFMEFSSGGLLLPNGYLERAFI